MSKIWQKAMVYAIIGLLIGSGFLPMINAELNSNDTLLLQKKDKFNENLLFDEIIELVMKFGYIPSLSACIIKKDEMLWSKGYGYFDIEHEKPATNYTTYIIASISKTITATAVMQLYEEGLFDLDDDVNSYLDFNIKNPFYPEEPITFRMLLSHRASLAAEPISFYRIIYGEDPPSLSIWIQSYFYTNEIPDEDIWIDVKPGERFRYSNIGFCLLAYLVEQISHQPFNEYCKEHIFQPLNMQNTSFLFSDINESNHAIPYTLFYKGKKDEHDIYLPIPFYSIIFSPAGGLKTNVIDLSHFLIAHMNGGVYHGFRILGENTIDLMHNISTFEPLKRFQYGLGWVVFLGFGRRTSGNLGLLYGYCSCMKYRSSDDCGVIFFINRDTSYVGLKGILAFQLIEHLLFLFADNFP